jgi:thiamine pyrophosphokinase
MESEALIALKLTDDLPDLKGDWIGADKGALVLADKGIRMKLAIGDFDSVEEESLAKIHAWAQEVIRLNPIKDDTDSEAAFRAAMARGYTHATMIGALGGRVDHELINLRLAYQNPQKLTLLGKRNRIEAYGQGTWEFDRSQYPFISFFTDEEAVITLKGMKYPLENRRINVHDLYTVSNELTGERGSLIVHEGTVLVIQAKD